MPEQPVLWFVVPKWTWEGYAPFPTMTRTHSTSLFFLLLLIGSAATAQDLTLGDVVRMTLARNERSRQAALEVTVAESSVDKVRSGLLPTVTLTASETLRPYSEESGGRSTVRSNAASAALTITQPIVSPSTYSALTAARQGLETARLDATDQRRQLAFEAARAFFSVIAQQQVLAAAERRLERAEASLADTQARVAAQIVSSNDVTRAQIERSKAVQSVAGARGALSQVRINLETMIDATIQAGLRTPDNYVGPVPLDSKALEAQAMTHRPDLAAAGSAAQEATSLANEAKWRWAPTLNAVGQARVADQPIAGDRYYDTTLAFNFTWVIYDGGTRGSDEASRVASAEKLRLQQLALKRSVRADVRQAIAALSSAKASLLAAEEAVRAARQGADETSVLYKEGLAKAIELVDANLSRFDAEVNLAAAQLDERQAVLDLRSALGMFPIDGVP